MDITFNGEAFRLKEPISLIRFLQRVDVDPQDRGIAVALNDIVVPRSEWERITVEENDNVEVIHAAQGG